LGLSPVKAQNDSAEIRESEVSVWPRVINRNGDYNTGAWAFALQNDSFKTYIALPYTWWTLQKPFEALDAFDPFTPPEYAIIPRPRNNNLLIFIVLLNVMFIIAIIKISNERHLLSFVSSLYSSISAVKYYGERQSVFNRVNIQLLLVQLMLLALGLTLYEGLPAFLPNGASARFLSIFGFFLMVILLKIFVNWSIEKIFEIERLSVVVANHTIGVNFVATIVLLPVFLIIYLNASAETAQLLPVIAASVLLVAVVVRILRSYVVLNLSFQYPKVYLLLYFCVSEVLPWFIIFKLIAF
jgi:hypothetical protein